MKLRTFFLIFVFLGIFSLITVADDYSYWNYLTKSRADTLYCLINGDCSLGSLVVGNLSVTDSYVNITVENYNVTGTVNADNFTGNLYGTWNGSIDYYTKIEIDNNNDTLVDYINTQDIIFNNSMKNYVDSQTYNDTWVNGTFVYQGGDNLTGDYVLEDNLIDSNNLIRTYYENGMMVTRG